jgi:hypothetical protein
VAHLRRSKLSIPLEILNIPAATALMTAAQAVPATEDQQQQVWNIETMTVVTSDPLDFAEQLAALQSPY